MYPGPVELTVTSIQCIDITCYAEKVKILVLGIFSSKGYAYLLLASAFLNLGLNHAYTIYFMITIVYTKFEVKSQFYLFF